MSDCDSESDGTITLYFKCLKCGRANSHLAFPPYVMPFTECPHCGGEITFEPNCYVCGFNGDILECTYDCKDFSKFVQMTPKERR
jgi:DNA-directed RNA polymerase subunit RPC12/RpoP